MSVIPAEAVEAAAKASWEKSNSDPWISGDADDLRWADRRAYLDDAKVMLEAAAPHMHRAAWNEGFTAARAMQEFRDTL